MTAVITSLFWIVSSWLESHAATSGDSVAEVVMGGGVGEEVAVTVGVGVGERDAVTVGVGVGSTVNVTTSLIMLPPAFITFTLKVEPLSDKVVEGIVYIAVIAEILAPFFCQLYVNGAVPVATILNVAASPTSTI